MSKEFGIDLPKALGVARKAGKNTFDAFIDIAESAIKGDMERVNRIFADKEARRGLTALLLHRALYHKLIEQAAEANGTIATDAARKSKDAQAAVDRLGNAFNAAAVASGRLLGAVGVTTLLETVAEKAGGAATSVQDLSEKVRELGALEGTVKWLAVGPAADSPEAKAFRDKAEKDPNGFFAARYHTAPAPLPGIWGQMGVSAPTAMTDLARREALAKAYPLPSWLPQPGLPDAELDHLRRTGLPQPRPALPGEVGGITPMPRARPDPFEIPVQLDDASLDSEVQRLRARLQSNLDANPLVLRARVDASGAGGLNPGRSFSGGNFTGAP